MNPGNLFSTYSYAVAQAQKLAAAMAVRQGKQENAPLPGDAVAPQIIDGVNDPNPANRDYAANFSSTIAPPASWPPPDSYTSVFEWRGSVMIGAKQYLAAVVIGDFGVRECTPDQEQGDRNFIQVGHGADEVNAPVKGTAVDFLLIDEPNSQGIAEPYYTAPA